MAWDLGSWLGFVRSLQLLGTLVSGSLNGYLLAYIISNKLGESQVMVCLEWIVRPPLSLPLPLGGLLR